MSILRVALEGVAPSGGIRGTGPGQEPCSEHSGKHLYFFESLNCISLVSVNHISLFCKLYFS